MKYWPGHPSLQGPQAPAIAGKSWLCLDCHRVSDKPHYAPWGACPTEEEESWGAAAKPLTGEERLLLALFGDDPDPL